MRTIRKGVEPPSLTKHRCAAHADYDNYQDKDTLREYLVREQRGLCCYCMGRLRADAESMKVEHWRDQSSHPAEQLDYRNLLGACLGGEGQPFAQQHCDTRKGDRPLSRNPADPAHYVEHLIRYGTDGTIASDDAAFDEELNQVLNLNHPFLRNNRKATLDGFLAGASRRQGNWDPRLLECWVRDWQGNADTSELPPFCQIVVYWLRKRLARA